MKAAQISATLAVANAVAIHSKAHNEDMLQTAVDAGQWAVDHQDDIAAGAGMVADAASSAWDAISSGGWAENQNKNKAEGILGDAASLAWDNRDAIADVATQAWNGGWAESKAENEDMLQTAVDGAQWAVDHQDDIAAAAGAVGDAASSAWNAISSGGWAENKAEAE